MAMGQVFKRGNVPLLFFLFSTTTNFSRQTKEKGGMFMNARLYDRKPCPSLNVTGSFVKRTGLVFDDKLLVRYKSGLVHIRKQTENIPQALV